MSTVANTAPTAKLVNLICYRRPICPCALMKKGQPGLVRFNDADYSLSYIAESTEAIRGYRLVTLSDDEVKVYDIDAETMLCDCPDTVYRQRKCKHVLALEELRRGGNVA